jgi:glycosyltransferase involved in cell wall biosynthesis
VRAGVEPTVVFLGSHEPLSRLLEQDGIAYHDLGYKRGSRVLFHPKRFANLVGTYGEDGVILDSSGYVAWALRAGGYRGRIVSVEHGVIVQENLTPRKRFVRRIDRITGSRASDIEVAVSDFLLEELVRRRHAQRVVRIHNGLDLTLFHPVAARGTCLSIGWAGRMVEGKGVVELLHAVARLDQEVEVHLAGEGPDRSALGNLVNELRLDQKVVFAGPVLDMAAFWANCDMAVFPTNGSIESFGLAAIEAMACGKPVVASRIGGLAEVVEDGTTGSLVEPGDIEGLARALRRYALDEGLRLRHGCEARSACERRFDIKETAAQYLALFES